MGGHIPLKPPLEHIIVTITNNGFHHRLPTVRSYICCLPNEVHLRKRISAHTIEKVFSYALCKPQHHHRTYWRFVFINKITGCFGSTLFRLFNSLLNKGGVVLHFGKQIDKTQIINNAEGFTSFGIDLFTVNDVCQKRVTYSCASPKDQIRQSRPSSCLNKLSRAYFYVENDNLFRRLLCWYEGF